MSGMRLAKVLEWMFLPYANDMTIGRIELGKLMVFLQKFSVSRVLREIKVGLCRDSKIEETTKNV